MLLALLAAACGGGSKSGEPLLVVTDGTTIHLYAVRSGGLVELDSDDVPDDGSPAAFLPNHTIFAAAKHPTKSWIYVTSFNDCTGDCWGNARIDRFTFGPNAIQHAERVFSYEAASGPFCADDDDMIAGVVGQCAPVGMAFSPSGDKLYVQDDDCDCIQTFSVAGDGSLTFDNDGDGAYLHGVAVNGAGTRVYNGSTTYDVTGGSASEIFSGDGGNDTMIADVASAEDTLFSTNDTDVMEAYDLASPDMPSSIDSFAFGNKEARAFAASSDRSRFVVVGRDLVTTLSFDPMGGFAFEDDFAIMQADTIENRSIALVDDTLAVVAFFVQATADGGITLYDIASDGTITENSTTSLSGLPRKVLVLQ